MPWSPIVVALIGGPLTWLLHRLDERNTKQHAENTGTLERIESKLDVVDNRLDKHIEWHLKDAKEGGV